MEWVSREMMYLWHRDSSETQGRGTTAVGTVTRRFVRAQQNRTAMDSCCIYIKYCSTARRDKSNQTAVYFLFQIISRTTSWYLTQCILNFSSPYPLHICTEPCFQLFKNSPSSAWVLLCSYRLYYHPLLALARSANAERLGAEVTNYRPVTISKIILA
jgi:hypothetical protein